VYIYDEVIQKNNNGQLTQGTFEKHPFKGSAKESVNMLSLVFLGMYDNFLLSYSEPWNLLVSARPTIICIRLSMRQIANNLVAFQHRHLLPL